mmetsp:Transcript_13693/g.18980  ORF Transcript_13693/g.18980 Transcript_13693/m.18980 type:complete len:137 (+) Transcript_13693:271-681(+)
MEGVLHAVCIVLQFVLSLNSLLCFLVCFFVFFCIFDDSGDVFLAESSFLVLDGDVVLVASGLVHSSNVQDSISVQIELDFNLRHSSWSWRNVRQVESSQLVVVSCELSFSFKDLDSDSRLIIRVSGEDLALAAWNG